MASTVVIERIALYDNSRKDENGNACLIRLPWDLVTTKPGLSGSPYTQYLEPVPANLVAICGSNFKTDSVGYAYHGVKEIDAKNILVPGNEYATGGENRVDA